MSTSPAPTNGSTSAPSPAPSTGAAATSKSAITSADVGWQFVPQYYTFVNKHPQRLHCFYTKNSTFIHGVEGEDGLPCTGQAAINERIEAIGFKDCKVYIHSVDSQPSAGGGIIIQVIGEMSNAAGPWRKFAQTFFLAEQPNGYFVLNDIFRFLKEDTVADEEEEDVAEAVDGYDKLEESVPVAVPETKIEVAEKEEAVVSVQQEEVPKAAEQKVEETPAPVSVKEEAPKSTVEETTSAVATSAPKPVVNGQAEKPAAETPAAPAETPAPVETPAPAASAQKAIPPPAPAAPAAPAKLAAPKSWAALAASKSSPAAGAWGKPAPAPAAPAPAPAPAAAPKEVAPAPAAVSAAPAQPSNKKLSAAAEAALSVQTAHCFVKLANWAATSSDRDTTLDPEMLRSALQARFGKVKELEIVKSKACAFLEFENVAAARQAILASLPVGQGGEGGVKVEDGRVLVETRKEKNERGPPRGAPRSLTPGQGPSPGFTPGAGRGGRGGARGGRGGLARSPGAPPAASK